MNQTILVGKNVDESPKIGDPHHFAIINLSSFNILDNLPNDFFRRLGTFRINSGNRDGAIITNINLATSLLGDAANNLAPGANDIANFVLMNFQGENARRMSRKIITMGREYLMHLA